jgi:hypothetical protein
MAKTIFLNHAHLVGLGRPAVLYPSLPQQLLCLVENETKWSNNPLMLSVEGGVPAYPLPTQPSWLSMVPIHIVGAGLNTAWYCALMGRISRGYWRGLVFTSGKADNGPSNRIVDRGTVPYIGALQSLWEMWIGPTFSIP